MDTTSNNDEDVSCMQGRLDFCKKLAKLSSLEISEEEKWWKSFEKSISSNNPLNIAVMIREDLPIIQSLYESDPSNLNEYTLKLACRFGGKEGVIPFLAEKVEQELITAERLCEVVYCDHNSNVGDISALARRNPEAVSHYRLCEDDGMYPIVAAMNNGVAESDVRTLVERWPECVVSFGQTEMDWSPTWEPPLQNCLRKGYSEELLQFMIKQLPETIDCDLVLTPLRGRSLTESDLLWIEEVLKRCNGELDCSDLWWKGPGFHDFLGVCFFKAQGINELLLSLPSKIDDDSTGYGTDNVELSMKRFKETYSQQQKGYPNTRMLDLKIPHPAYCDLLDLLPNWPFLHELSLDVKRHLDSSMAALCNLLHRGRLRRLELCASKRAIASKKRKNPSEEVYVPLKPFFGALATNKTIKFLSINLNTRKERTIHCDLLLKALKQNTTLEEIHGFFIDRASAWCRIVHYLKLNSCGRRIAQDDSKSLEELVCCLGSIEEQLTIHGYRSQNDYDIVSALYGLLREGISKWS